jgi:hypothetical protein
MGERLPDPDSELWVQYFAHVEALQKCCDDPGAPGCIVEPIGSKKEWLERQKWLSGMEASP